MTEESEAVKNGETVHKALEIWILAPPEHDPRIWKGTSNRYRTIARLPEGKSGVEALKDAAPDQYRNIMREVERRAADTYRRMYAEREGNSLMITQEEWAAFKAAGGESSW